jgi:predicted RNA-binding protein with PUA-like domain
MRLGRIFFMVFFGASPRFFLADLRFRSFLVFLGGLRSRFIMRYWLLKSEPSSYSIGDMARDRTTAWHGVRNYQTRNFMRDQMRVGDRAFFYHSNCDEPGIVGIVEVCAPAHADETQFDPKSDYYDPEAKREAPRWLNVDVKFVKKTPLISLEALRREKHLARMRILQRGNRLSITPVDPEEWKLITKLAARAG